MNFSRPEFYILFFVAMWFAINVAISRLSGWTELASIYSYTEKFNGIVFRFQSAKMRWMMGYNNCLTIGSDPRGIYLSIMFLFRAGHPSILIPWSNISVKTKKGRFISYKELRFLRAPSIPLIITENLWSRLADSTRNSFLLL